MKPITHLVVNGCSFTYCQGLESPSTEGWPAIVAKSLGVEVVNLAAPGSGNDGIHRRTYEYLYQNLTTESNPLYVIAWSQFWRREAWYNDCSDYRSVMPVQVLNDDPDLYQQAIFPFWNEEDFARKSLIHKTSLIHLFSQFNVPHLMSDYCNDVDVFQNPNFLPQFDVMKKLVMNHPFNIDQLHTLTSKLPKTHCGHDTEEGQKIVAAYILKKIKELMPTLRVKKNGPHNFVKLSETRSIKNLKNTEWM